VNLNSRFVPANIKGRLAGNPPGRTLGPGESVAISVNGKIRGVTQTYRNPEGEIRFSLVLSDSNFQTGYNQVRIYLASRNGDRVELMNTEGSEIPPYHWGDVLTFGSRGNGLIYQAGGWSRPEDKITWTDGDRAELVLPTSSTKTAIRLRLLAGAYLRPGTLDRQRLRLYVNRHPVADWTLTSRDFKILEAMISPSLFESNRAIITLEMPDSAIPNRIGDGPDLRQLGLAMAWLSLAEP